MASLILGTYTTAEVKEVVIQKNKATISLLLYSNKPSLQAKFLKFFVLDLKNNLLSDINEFNYWLDSFYGSTNNTSNKNISVNFYKKISFTIDISNNQTADFDIDRWIRTIRLVAKVFSLNETETTYQVENNNGSWFSEPIQLISEKINVPEIKNLTIKSYSTDAEENEDGNYETLNVELHYDYLQENDFSYINSNIKYRVSLTNALSLTPIQTLTVSENGASDIDTKIGVVELEFTGLNINVPIIVNVEIINPLEVVLKTLSKVFRPFAPKTRTYIKHKGIVKEIVNIYVNDINESLEGNGELNIYKNTTGLKVKS